MNPTDKAPSGRRLSAVLHADMVNYATVTARSEALSLRCVAVIREAFAEAVPKRGGWFRAKAGDAVLALFPSAVGAVATAIEVQRGLAEIRAASPELPLWLRVGVHMGEVAPSGDDWHGDSINTTARIQAEALPGGLTISSEVHRAISNTMELAYEDLGTRDLKGVGTFHLFRVVTGTELVDRPPWYWFPLYRRELGIAAAVAIAAALFGRSVLDLLSGRATMKTAVPARTDGWPLAIAIMEIRPAGEAPEWMSNVTHQGLNALLSKFDKLSVFSKDVIDWKKEKTGKKSFDIAKELGVTKMINGELIRSGLKLTLETRIVDTDTGLQVGTCEASAPDDKLVEIQNDVGMQIVWALKVPVTKAEIDKILRARTNVDLDVTKRFADAFGGEKEAAAPPPDTQPGTLLWFAWPSEAHAEAGDEQAVKELLERYRAALEAKNLDELATVYLTLGENTRDALTRYFQSATDLKVQFSGIKVLFEGDEALATFTRSDKFKDVQTGRDVNLEVRVSTVVARQDGSWKIKALRKPS